MMNFHPLADDDVVELDYESHALFNNPSCSKVSELLESLRSDFKIDDSASDKYVWIGKGIAAKVLQSDHNLAGWQEGRISLNVGFAPHQNSKGWQKNAKFALQELDTCSVELELSLLSGASFMVQTLYTHFRNQLRINDISQMRYHWFSRGIDCTVLKNGGEIPGWQAGFVRLQLEFLPKAPPTISNATKSEQSDLNSLRQVVDDLA